MDQERRVAFLNRLAEKYAEENFIEKETAIRELLDHEELLELFRMIRLKMKGVKSPQLSEVWVQTREEEKIVLSATNSVESYLIQRNKEYLRKVSAIPFAEGYLGDQSNYDGSGDLANKIIDGTHLQEFQKLDETILQ